MALHVLAYIGDAVIKRIRVRASNRDLSAEVHRANDPCDAVRVQLREAEAAGARASAEAATLQAVLQRLTPPEGRAAPARPPKNRES